MIKLRKYAGKERNTEGSFALNKIIINVILSTFKITEKDLKFGGRKKHLVAARQIYCSLSLNFTDLTLLTISEKINKHHSTVLSSKRTADNRINSKYDTGIIYKKMNFNELYNEILTKINNLKNAYFQI
jgi:chromosomal replication initiation ATPase DnaA